MATDKLTNVANALSQLFAKKLARQYNRMAVLGQVIPTERDGQGSAKNIAWDVEMGGAVAGSYAEGADVDPSEISTDTLVPATLSWGHYRGAFQCSETEFDAAAASAGSADRVRALFSERVLSANTALAQSLNSDLWVGTGSDGSSNPNIVGIHGGALEATGLYAGINRSSYALWKGNVLANGGIARPLTIDLMEQMDQNIFTASGERANVIVTSPGVFRKYKGLFESIRRVEGTGPIPRYDTSVSSLFFQGDIAILRDKDAPAGTMSFLNTNRISKTYLPVSSQSVEDVFKVMEEDGKGSNGDGEENPLDLPFRIVPLAKNGDSLKFMVKCVLQLKLTRPNSMGYIKDIAE